MAVTSETDTDSNMIPSVPGSEFVTKLFAVYGIRLETKNKGVHLYARELNLKIDVWPTTQKVHITIPDSIKLAFAGATACEKAIIALKQRGLV